MGSITNPLTEIAREDARRTLMVALKAEADGFVARFGDAMLAYGRQRVVRRGAGPEREIRTGIGPIAVQRQKVRDRAPDAPPGARIRFTSNILPKWARRTRSPDALPPALYLRGVFTGDFQEAMSALLGVEAPNLSPGVIARLGAGLRTVWNAAFLTKAETALAELVATCRDTAPNSRHGWRKTFPRASPSSRRPSATAAACAPRTRWSAPSGRSSKSAHSRSEEALERLFSAILAEIYEKWAFDAKAHIKWGRRNA